MINVYSLHCGISGLSTHLFQRLCHLNHHLIITVIRRRKHKLFLLYLFFIVYHPACKFWPCSSLLSLSWPVHSCPGSCWGLWPYWPDSEHKQIQDDPMIQWRESRPWRPWRPQLLSHLPSHCAECEYSLSWPDNHTVNNVCLGASGRYLWIGGLIDTHMEIIMAIFAIFWGHFFMKSLNNLT